MLAGDIAIEIKGVEKSFHDIHVLKGVDLTVRKGSIYALLGSNGAGKTTTINILSTLMSPDKGVAAIHNFDVTKQSDKVRELISLTGQYAAVDEVLTGYENLQMIGNLRHLTNVDQTAGELLKKFGLENASKRRVSTYSGGMRRKLDLAMGMMGDPAVIFLDEPTTGLDPQSRASMWSIVKSLAESGITIFLTTQYLEEAEQLADRIAILNNGVIVAEGTPAQLKKKLPQGIIALSFQNEEDVSKVMRLLSDFTVKQDREMLSLTVVTDGSIGQLTDICNRVHDEKIKIASFTQKLPTLEDVFYVLIGEKQEVLGA